MVQIVKIAMVFGWLRDVWWVIKTFLEAFSFEEGVGVGDWVECRERVVVAC
jgi:hypothetical protein